MTHTPTPEQARIILASTSTKDNLLITARAGAAKTSTLVLIAEALPQTDILALAFNKANALDITNRLPGNCKSSTMHSLGMKVLGGMLGSRPKVDFKKMFNLTSAHAESLRTSEAERFRGTFKDILATLREAKAAGYIPPDCPGNRPDPIISREAFFEGSEYILDEWEQEQVDEILRASIRVAYAEGKIDFDDMVYLPALFRATFPLSPLVMVDEAQDLSLLNHRFLSRLARRRLIAVGDPCQAIYGFRGAHEESMAQMGLEFSMTPLSLTVSFRSPPALVEHVRWRAPDMQAWEGNPRLGAIHDLPSWSIHNIPDGAAIICRNNAPLYRLATTFLKHGRPAKLANGNMAKTIEGLLRKLAPRKALSREEALPLVDAWERKQSARSRAKVSIRDNAECMRIFLSQTQTLSGACALARDLALYEGPVQLMTGHRSKGMEFPDVFFLDQHLVGDKGQDPNIRYVVCTRAEHTLTYITSEGCVELPQREEVDMAPPHGVHAIHSSAKTTVGG